MGTGLTSAGLTLSQPPGNVFFMSSLHCCLLYLRCKIAYIMKCYMLMQFGECEQLMLCTAATASVQ